MRIVNLSKIFILVLSLAWIAGCSSTGGTNQVIDPVAIETIEPIESYAIDVEPISTEIDTTEVDIDLEKQAKARAKEKLLALDNVVYFDFDKSNIKPEYRQLLNAHASYLAQNPSARIILEGHADERGTREYNMALGERRGNSVKRYLVVQGVPFNNLEVISYGEEKPVNTGHDSFSWAQNRRVELKYISY